MNIHETELLGPDVARTGGASGQFAEQTAVCTDDTRTGISSSAASLLIRFVNQMCAASAGVAADALYDPVRGTAAASRARQLAMYLLHTSMSFTLNEIASIYGKDRTTIGYACRLVEDLRDDRAFDEQVADFENILSTAKALTRCQPGERCTDA